MSRKKQRGGVEAAVSPHFSPLRTFCQDWDGCFPSRLELHHCSRKEFFLSLFKWYLTILFKSSIQSIAFSGEPSIILIFMLKLEYSCLPGGILLEILGRGYAAWFSKSWPYFRPKNVIFHTSFQTWKWSQNATLQFYIKQKLLHHCWDKAVTKRFVKIHFDFAYCTFFLIHVELKRRTHPYTTTVPSYPIPDQNGQNLCTFSDQNGAETLPSGAAHTYMTCMREYPPPHPTEPDLFFSGNFSLTVII